MKHSPICRVIYSLFACLTYVAANTAFGEEPLTPSHVYQQTEHIIAEIGLIRTAMDVADTPRNPGDVYDTTNMMLAEFTRMKVELGMTDQRISAEVPADKSPSHVLAQMQLIGSRLKAILGSV